MKAIQHKPNLKRAAVLLFGIMMTCATVKAQDTPCLPSHGETDNQSAWCGSEQVIALTEGWNWISTNREVSDPLVMLQTLETALGENATLIENNGITTEYLGSGFWFGTLENEGLTNDKMYLVHVSDSCTIELAGEPASSTVMITLDPGWNWIGFPSEVEMSITDFLSGFEAEVGDMIEHDGQVSEYLGYGFWIGLDTLVPGNGYLYYNASNESKTITFSIGAKAGGVKP